MVCIYCSQKTRVTNSRPQKHLHQVWRRRTCIKCGATFTTNEAADFTTSLVVLHSDNTLCSFNRDKLFVTIYRAVGHREQAATDAGALTATIITKLLHDTRSAAISTTEIVRVTLQTLKHFDNASAVQYAAYHTRNN